MNKIQPITFLLGEKLLNAFTRTTELPGRFMSKLVEKTQALIKARSPDVVVCRYTDDSEEIKPIHEALEQGWIVADQTIAATEGLPYVVVDVEQHDSYIVDAPNTVLLEVVSLAPRVVQERFAELETLATLEEVLPEAPAKAK